MNELQLLDKPVNKWFKISLMALGFLLSILTFMLSYNKFYMFFFEYRTYKNIKILYKWLEDGNIPTKSSFFHLCPKWETHKYYIRVFADGDLALFNSNSEIICCGFTPHRDDEKLVKKIKEKLFNLK